MVDARARAGESIALRFTRVMNASTSRWGMLSDPPVIAAFTSPLLIAFLAALRMDAAPAVIQGLGALAAAPIAVGLVVAVSLLGARRKVVDWLAGLPFPIENMNAVLNGLGDGLEIRFSGELPKAAEVNAALDQVSAESFVTSSPDTAAETPPADPEAKPAAEPEKVIEVKIGVVDSKRNPAATNHQRYERVRALVERVIVPLHAKWGVVEVRVK